MSYGPAVIVGPFSFATRLQDAPETQMTLEALPPMELLQQADAAYMPIQPYASSWDHCVVDAARWASVSEIVDQAKQSDSRRFRRALEVVRRVAAVETGAIEGLYDVDAGFTFTAATGAILATVGGNQEPDSVRDRLIASQLEGYEYVLDFATRKVPISETWLRQLHAVICANQHTYPVQTTAGPQEQELPKGEYKRYPNHVRTPDGQLHSYAPVIDTPIEMARLIEELNGELFDRAHPIVQAAYAHHAFVTIHPFSDGNGRVARALASVFTLRSHSIPLLILLEHKREYLSSLRRADVGDRQPFVGFTLNRAIDAAILLDQSLKTADIGEVDLTGKAVKDLYVTRGGFSHAAMDDASDRLLDQLSKACSTGLQAITAGVDGAGVALSKERRTPPAEVPAELQQGYRVAVNGPIYLSMRVTLPPPAQAEWAFGLWVYLPIEGRQDDMVLVTNGPEVEFQIRLSDLIPAITSITAWTVQMFADRVVARAAQHVAEVGRNRLKDLGYL